MVRRQSKNNSKCDTKPPDVLKWMQTCEYVEREGQREKETSLNLYIKDYLDYGIEH